MKLQAPLKLPDHSDGVLFLHTTALRPRMSEEEFLRTHEGASSAGHVLNPPHASYKLLNRFTLEGLEVGVLTWFYKGRLAAINIFIASGTGNWSDWSEAEELERRDKLENVLTKRYGASRDFAWGSVSAAYDPRSGSASLTIRYD